MFAEAIMRFPDCQPIVPRLRKLKDESLEAALQDLQFKATDYPRGLEQLAAVRYYLQHILWQCGTSWKVIAKGITNYKVLLDQIERANKKNEPVCLVTFNYDTLLEDALSHFGLSIEAFRDYTKKHPFYRVFKVHGSVNWARIAGNRMYAPNATDPMSVAQECIRGAAELNITQHYVLTSGCPPPPVDRWPAFPAIALPVEKEKNFECPADLIMELEALLPQTKKVLVIGWRATEEHFLALLKKYLRPGVRVHVVAGSLKDVDEAQGSIRRALKNNSLADISGNDEGFTDFIHSDKVEDFLDI